jgi:hypothetical protein
MSAVPINREGWITEGDVGAYRRGADDGGLFFPSLTAGGVAHRAVKAVRSYAFAPSSDRLMLTT